MLDISQNTFSGLADISLILATKNIRKGEEAAAILKAGGWSGATPLGVWEAENGRPAASPAENGRTLAANAVLKARAYAAAVGEAVLAEDSGLMVPALGGAPGVHSARFGGPGRSDEERCRLLLGLMRARRDQRAFFGAVAALARPDGRYLLWRGRLDGYLVRTPRGENGFGYDPVFRPLNSSLTLAQISPELKNSLSHRARALQAFLADKIRALAFLEGLNY